MDAPEGDVDAGLEDRLLNHSRAFESLLALTPARDYYGSHIVDGQDPSEQWNRKKQTKEEKRAAKKAKLDPINQKSALDVMKERELKRKRELGMPDDTEGEPSAQAAQPAAAKRAKLAVDPEASEQIRKAKAEKRKDKRVAKQEKVAKKKAKIEAKKSAKTQEPTHIEQLDLDDVDDDKADAMDIEGFDASGLVEPLPAEDIDENIDTSSSVTSSTKAQSPAFDVATNHSTSSSSSSIPPASEISVVRKPTKPSVKTHIEPISALRTADFSKKSTSGTASPKIQLPDIDQAQLQERLRQRIEQLRARRKADGPDGRPAKSRQELLEQRRKKEEQRKAAKKEQRRKAKEEEERQQEVQLRGSGSPLSGNIFGARSPQEQENNFSFSRLAFADGTAATADLSGLSEARKAKGKSDPKTALEAAQRKQSRIAGLDAEKRADIAEKDLWLNAKKRAHGEHVRDDTSLLKKALKRKEKQKSKSEKAWQEREQAVVKGKVMKEKRREANLQKRKDEKGQKGKKKAGSARAGGGGGGKKKGRPGFEGRFKA